MNVFVFDAKSSEVQVLKSMNLLYLPVEGFEGNIIHADVNKCPDFKTAGLEDPEYDYYETISDEAYNGDDSLFEKVSINFLVKNVNKYCLKCISSTDVTLEEAHSFVGLSFQKFFRFLKMVDARIQPGFNYEDFKMVSLDEFDASLLVKDNYIFHAFENYKEFNVLHNKIIETLTASHFNDGFTSESLREVISKRLIKRAETFVEVDGLFNYFNFSSETILNDLMKDFQSVIVTSLDCSSFESFSGERLNLLLKIYLNPVNLRPNFVSLPLIEFIEFKSLLSKDKNFVSKETIVSPVLKEPFNALRAEQSMAIINSVPSEDNLSTMFKLYDLDNETMSNLKKLFEIVTLL